MQSQQRFWFVYILADKLILESERDKKGSRWLYTGITNDVGKRILEHNAGSVVSTHGGEWEIRAVMPFTSQYDAAIVERWLKVGDARAKKLKCIDRYERGLINKRFCDFALAHATEWANKREENRKGKVTVHDATESRTRRKRPASQSKQPV